MQVDDKPVEPKKDVELPDVKEVKKDEKVVLFEVDEYG